MSNNLQGHILKIKVGDEWAAIPVSVINVYNVYVAYCIENNITPVSENTYYKILGNLESYVQQLTGLNSLANSITELTKALSDGNLPVDKGGTGVSFKNEAELVQWLKTKLSDETHSTFLTSKQYIDKRVDSLQKQLTSKLTTSEIKYGQNEPNPSTSGLVYFQYTE